MCDSSWKCICCFLKRKVFAFKFVFCLAFRLPGPFCKMLQPRDKTWVISSYHCQRGGIEMFILNCALKCLVRGGESIFSLPKLPPRLPPSVGFLPQQPPMMSVSLSTDSSAMVAPKRPSPPSSLGITISLAMNLFFPVVAFITSIERDSKKRHIYSTDVLKEDLFSCCPEDVGENESGAEKR